METARKIYLISLLLMIYNLSDAQDVHIEDCYGADPVLFNGTLYRYYSPAQGTQYFRGNTFETGSITMDGIKYEGLSLNYDVFNQLLVLQFETTGGGIDRIPLSDGRLESFTLYGAGFVVIGDSNHKPAIYRTVGDGELKVLHRYTKLTGIGSSVTNNRMQYLPMLETMFLYDGERLMKFTGNKAFAALFPEDKQREIRKYLRQNRINMKRAEDKDIEGVLTRFSLKKPDGEAQPGISKQSDISNMTKGQLIYPPGTLPDSLPLYGQPRVKPQETPQAVNETQYITGRKIVADRVIDLEEFVVKGDPQMNVKTKDPGIEKIPMRTVKDLPMMMGERDILKVSGLLPGITSAGEGTAGLNVRGGSSDQNAFYINKVPVYNTSHLFGFFPAFNSDIIRDFSIYKGHIPARYGGRLSSVFNIVTRQGNRKKLMARGGISPVTAGIVAEGPLWKDKSSLLLSFRSSYSDWILERMDDPQVRASNAGFIDFAGSAGIDFGKNSLGLFVYHSNDKFTLGDVTGYDYSNNGASLTVGRVFNSQYSGELSLIASQYAFSTRDIQEPVAAYEHKYLMEHYEVRADFTHRLYAVHSLEYGVGTTLYRLDRGIVNPWGEESIRIPVNLGKEQGAEAWLHLSDTWEVNPWLTFSAGLRYGLFLPLGPQEVYTYNEGGPIDLRYVSDTLYYGHNKVIQWNHQPDLRISVNIATDENGSVKLAFNQTHQNLFMLSNTMAVAPTTQWKLADYHLDPSKGMQVSAGVFRTLGTSGLEASAEAFFKHSDNYPQFKEGADFLETPRAETSVLQGDLKAYGIELMLKRNNKKLEGWVSYTWSHTSTQVTGNQWWEKINNGEPYRGDYDIPHALNLVLNYRMSRRVTFSSVVAYQTGRPVTYPVSVYYIKGVPYLNYSARNAYRIPDYFRTDISMTIEGNLRKKKLLHSSLNISVYNLTGRDNPFSVFFRNEKGRIKSYRYSVIGVPILTATWLFKLGNYAAE